MADRYEEKARDRFASGDWDALQHVRFLREGGGAGAGYTADLIEKMFAALRDQDTWWPIDDPAHPAPRDGTRLLAVVDGLVRIVSWGKTSHVPLYGFCLADQGAEEYDLCQPTHYRPLPAPPLSGRKGE